MLEISEQLLRIYRNSITHMAKKTCHAEKTLHRPAYDRMVNITKNILIVSEDPDITDVLATFLGEHGFTIITRTNGLDALYCFYHGTFDLVITDISMAAINGNTLIRHMKKVCETVPVVALARSSAYVVNLFDQIIKTPFTCDELLFIVEKLLDRPAVVMQAE
jgi:DNA-binding response OmpR family regulator